MSENLVGLELNSAGGIIRLEAFKLGWKYDPKTEYNRSEASEIHMGELIKSMYFENGVMGDITTIEKLNEENTKKDLGEGKILVIPIGNHKCWAYGLNTSSGNQETFIIKPNQADGKVKVTVTGVLKYKNPTEDDSEEQYAYLFTVTIGGTTYTDVFINMDNDELGAYTHIPREPKRARKEPTTPPPSLGEYTGASPGYAHPLSTPPGSQPNSGAGGGGNARNLTSGGGRKTYKTRKYKRTRRHTVTMPRKWSTRRGTRRR